MDDKTKKVVKVGLMALSAVAGFAIDLVSSDVIGKKDKKTAKSESEKKKTKDKMGLGEI